jgi:hypothetical protein
MRALVQFTLPSDLVGATVTSASLELRGTNSPTSFTTNVRVARISSSWNESVTYNTQPTFTSSDAFVEFLNPTTTGPRTWTWNVTDIAQSWANGSTNYGVMVKRDSETAANGLFAFNSLDYTGVGAKPTLIITYTPIVTVPLPAPVISVNTSTSSTDLTDTTALVRWTWSGSTANSTSITVTVRDLLTNSIIVSDPSVADTATSYPLTGLNPSNQYRINIAYKPAAGYSQGSQDYEFYTRFSAPLLSNPNNGAYDGPPAQLGWQPDSGAWTMAHRLQISTTTSGFTNRTGFSSPLVDATPATAAYSWSGGTIGQTYYWSARQASSTGAGPSTSYYSTPRSFIYGAEPNPLASKLTSSRRKELAV